MFARILTFKASNCKSLQIWWKPRVFVPTGTSTSHWSWMFFHSSKQTSGSWDHPLTLADPEAERMRHSFISDMQQTAGSSLSEGYLKLNSLKLTRKNCKNNEEITKLYTVAPVQLSWMLCPRLHDQTWSLMTVKLITGSAQDGIYLDVVSSTQGKSIEIENTNKCLLHLDHSLYIC